MPGPWAIPANFDGAKFAARYSLTREQYTVVAGMLSIASGVGGVPDPPILDVLDTPAVKAAAVNLAARTAAKAVFLTGTDANAKILRATILVLLDQINSLRALLPIPLGAITVAQAKAAIQAKIDGGSVD